MPQKELAQVEVGCEQVDYWAQEAGEEKHQAKEAVKLVGLL